MEEIQNPGNDSAKGSSIPIILCSVFLPVISIILIWTIWKERWNSTKKIMISVILAVYSIILISALTNRESAKNNQESNPTSSQTEVVSSEQNSQNSETEKEENKATPSPAPEKEPYEVELTAGYYTSGIDFPEGVYTVTAVSGLGNVSSDNMFSGGLNEIMAPKDDGLTISKFSNAKLPKGTVLSVSGVKIKISCKEADFSTMEKRKNSTTEEVELTSGDFIAGTDFPAGTYDILAVSGQGNVSSDNMFSGGLNAIMAPKDDDIYESQYKNIELSEGTTLTISGVEVKLIPSE